MDTKIITFIGKDHWHNGVPLTTGQDYEFPIDLADWLIEIGKAKAVE